MIHDLEKYLLITTFFFGVKLILQFVGLTNLRFQIGARNLLHTLHGVAVEHDTTDIYKIANHSEQINKMSSFVYIITGSLQNELVSPSPGDTRWTNHTQFQFPHQLGLPIHYGATRSYTLIWNMCGRIRKVLYRTCPDKHHSNNEQ